ncbi:hypothetical protein Brsp02_01056 [Brucella sp. NBRC 113783]
MAGENKPWLLSRIDRIKDGLHEITFNVDEQPAVKLTIRGSFSLQGCGVEGVLSAARGTFNAFDMDAVRPR